MQFNGIRIAKIAGIEIWLDYSWLIIFFIILISFTAGLLPALFPGLPWLVTAAAGVITTLLFFGSVVAHELSHSLYAKSQGLKVKRITLFIFGGASELLSEPTSPRQEFLIAAVGPLTSLGLGVVFLLVWLIGNAAGLEPLAAMGSILATANIALAIFNLLPGFPLDGGRIFRSLVWRSTGNLETATRYAAAGGRALGLGLVVIGLLQIVFAQSLGGLWMILIGLFLRQAAGLSHFQTMSKIILKDLKVGDLMSRNFIAVTRGTLVRELLEKYVLRYKDTPVIVKSDKRHAAGVLDVANIPSQALDEPVGAFLPPKTRVLNPRGRVMQALDEMVATGLSKLPVAEKGKPIGILTAEDVQIYVTSKSKLNHRR